MKKVIMLALASVLVLSACEFRNTEPSTSKYEVGQIVETAISQEPVQITDVYLFICGVTYQVRSADKQYAIYSEFELQPRGTGAGN